ncbi:MAG: hypothetical protein VX899_00810 [Myxococcota bacterium]|nr:hypothetical protein [Myxococcota bacterium]
MLWTSNTFDATLSAGVAFDLGPVSVQPAANLTFTNGEACSERFGWLGIDLSAS